VTTSSTDPSYRSTTVMFQHREWFLHCHVEIHVHMGHECGVRGSRERVNIYVHGHDLVSEEVHHGMWRIKGPALII
jgi:ABC-type thiamine transport system ATPase subunit